MYGQVTYVQRDVYVCKYINRISCISAAVMAAAAANFLKHKLISIFNNNNGSS